MKLSSYRSLNSKIKGVKRHAGRNNHGRLTVRHQGGGHKQMYRTVDWTRFSEEAVVTSFEYDPNRSARLAKLSHGDLLQEKDTYSYILAPKGLNIFDKLQNISEKRRNLFLRPGDSSILSNFEIGDFVHNIELFPGKGAVVARSAGVFCRVLQHYSKNYVKLKMPSGEQRLFYATARATLGVVGNEVHRQVNLLKAGRSRWLNRRPSVRGVAMNPVDHPHGGGQGKTKGGRPSVTPYSKPTKGQPTRNKRKKSKYIITVKSR